ncbi:MAG: YraN family protein [Rikenellaceae bacterium]
MGLTSQIGALGEKAAISYLRANGFLICERNWRHGRYEIDIIAQRWGVIHFVEVKSRDSGGWSRPEDAITQKKFDSLRRAASVYLAFNAFRGEHQFDLIAVEMTMGEVSQIRYVENAMQSHW